MASSGPRYSSIYSPGTPSPVIASAVCALVLTTQRSSLDRAVDWHILQVINIVFGFLGLAWEYPLPFLIPDTAFHRSIAARLAIYPISVFVAVLLYQGTNAAIYYMVGIAIYFWAYSEGEVSL